MKTRKIIYWAAVLIAIDILTIGIIGKVYTDYTGVAKSTKIVKLDDWGVNVTSVTAKTMSQLGNATTLTYQSTESLTYPGDTSAPISLFTITGTPNTDIDVTCQYTITLLKPNSWKVKEDGETYFPLTITIGSNKYTYDNIKNNNTFTYTYKLYKNNTVNWDEKINWTWAYEQKDASGSSAKYDAYDTALGNYKSSRNAPEFQVSATITMGWDNGDNPSSGDDDDDDDGGSTTGTTISGSAGTTAGQTQLPTIPGEMETSDGTTTDQTLSGNVETGDDSNIMLWLSLMAISAMAIIAVAVILIIRNRKEEQIAEKK